MSVEAVARTLDDAADLILIRGWLNDGRFSDADGRLCLVQAVVESNCPLSQVALDAVRSSGLTNGFTMLWNDIDANDEFEVMDMLRTVAKRVRNGELLVSE